MADTFTTTADEVLDGTDLTDKTALVTGATSGLGLETAKALAQAGANLVLAGRDADKLDAATSQVENEGSGTVTGVSIDLADTTAAADAGAQLADDLDGLDIVILNAGVMASPLERSPQGHENQLAVSYLGHVALIAELIDLLKSSNARVVTLSSSGHMLGSFDFDDPDYNERDYEKWGAYAQAKTATALLAIELGRRFGNDGITAAAVHPGVIKTDLQRHLEYSEEQTVMAMSTAQGEVRSPEAGAASIVWAATAPAVADNNGAYVANAAIANDMRAPHASSPEDAQRLWELTASMLDRQLPS